jgi:hypothetical protein
MQSTTLSAGDPIESRCTKCRKNTNHIIVAMTDEGPAKVQCNTCGGQHKYRPPTAPKKAAVRRTVDPKIAEQKEWQSLRPGMDSKQATDYSMTTAFKVDSLMNHPVFGLGLVQSLAGPRKVRVLFEDGKKTMRCK